MSRYTVDADFVLLDASPFWRCAEAGQLLYLARYLDKKAHITLEVDDELKHGATRYPDLKTLDLMRWPPEKNKLSLPAPQQQELLDIIRTLQEDGDHPLKHAGEVSTVLMAQELGGKLILLDDGDGKQLARRREVPRLSTAMLAAEMAVTEAVPEEEAFKLYGLVTPDGVGEAEWTQALERARAEIEA
ncbi:MAG: hypothetical protein U0R24_13710 [Solirubrobacterales bacterium]